MEIKIGISSCLLGEKVRFDGQHKKDNFVLNLLSPYVKWISVCPEVEAGMSIPREPIKLVKEGKKMGLKTVKTGKNVTKQIADYAQKKMALLESYELSGYILKKGSPSCGMERVKCYKENGYASHDGQGLFAQALIQAFPELPVEEEGRLQDAALRENFVERLFAYNRVKNFFRSSWTLKDLIAFHTAHKLQLLAHSPEDYKKLGLIVARAKQQSKVALEKSYFSLFMAAMRKKTAPGKNANALEHMAGYFKELLTKEEKKELALITKDHRTGILPLIVPIILIRHYVYKYSIDYLKGQTFLEPNPKELMLRNHV